MYTVGQTRGTIKRAPVYKLKYREGKIALDPRLLGSAGNWTPKRVLTLLFQLPSIAWQDKSGYVPGVSREQRENEDLRKLLKSIL